MCPTDLQHLAILPGVHNIKYLLLLLYATAHFNMKHACPIRSEPF